MLKNLLLVCSLSLPVWAADISLEAPQKGERLTPAISPKPSLNYPRTHGTYPQRDLIFRLPTSGEKPFKFSVKNLPKGLKLDSKTGIISGKVTQKGTYPISVKVSNKHGSDLATFNLIIGDELLLTPPMGWSSWYSLSESVSQEAVTKVIEAMHKSGLADFGFSYVNIDDCWQGERNPKTKVLEPNDRFKSMKALAQKAHSLGLKLGIYSTPWITTYAGFRGGSCENPEGLYVDNVIPEKDRDQLHQIYGRYPGGMNRKKDHVGAHWFFDKDAKAWADWGIDYVKVDWLPNDVPTTKRIAEDLKKSGRAIALSLSNAAPYENMDGLSPLSDVIRTTGDIQDHWGSISSIGFGQERWQKYVRPGMWPDPDMLQVGKLGKTNQKNAPFTPTRLTPDEQYTQLSLWSLLSAPLLLSCDLTDLDDFTLGLLCNKDVLSINQDSAGNPAKRLSNKEGIQVWTKELSDGRLAVGVFNLNNEAKTLTYTWEDLGVQSPKTIKDAWRQKQKGDWNKEDKLTIEVNPHGASLLILEDKKKN